MKAIYLYNLNWKGVLTFSVLFVDILIGILIYNACQERKQYSDIFGVKVMSSFKVIGKQVDEDINRCGDLILKNLKTGELITKEYWGRDEFLIFGKISEGDTITIRVPVGEVLSNKEKQDLWKRSEPYGYTWLAYIAYGFLSIFLICFYDSDDDRSEIIFVIIRGALVIIAGGLMGILI